MTKTPEEILNYETDERTRFRIRIEIDDSAEKRIEWIRGLTKLTECQRAFATLRDTGGYGASQMGDGNIFDEAGQHIARISYNGRLWRPWMETQGPIAEFPTDEDAE